MDQEQLDRLWREPANWKAGLIYYSREDPRVLVPKRWRWSGWTLNFSHPWAFPTLALLLAVAVGPVFLALSLEVRRPLPILLVVAASILLVLGVTALVHSVGRRDRQRG